MKQAPPTSPASGQYGEIPGRTGLPPPSWRYVGPPDLICTNLLKVLRGWRSGTRPHRCVTKQPGLPLQVAGPPTALESCWRAMESPKLLLGVPRNRSCPTPNSPLTGVVIESTQRQTTAAGPSVSGTSLAGIGGSGYACCLASPFRAGGFGLSSWSWPFQWLVLQSMPWGSCGTWTEHSEVGVVGLCLVMRPSALVGIGRRCPLAGSVPYDSSAE